MSMSQTCKADHTAAGAGGSGLSLGVPQNVPKRCTQRVDVTSLFRAG